jgi:multidrug efflux pump
MVPEDFNRWYVRNAAGAMVPFSAFARWHWDFGSPRLERYNGVPAVNITGSAAAGVSSGVAMARMEAIAATLPPGFAIEWSGQSFQERVADAQTPLLYGLSLLIVFLCLAALYESWSIPTSVLLVVPLGILGTVLFTWASGLERDVYFQVGMLTTVGLSSKNAVLIIEFAKANVERGMGLIEGTLAAISDRLRPILMTSIAFGFGVLPLALASGAGSGAQRAIGVGVIGGMLFGTFLGLFFIPLFFVVVRRLSGAREVAADAAPASGANPHD